MAEILFTVMAFIGLAGIFLSIVYIFFEEDKTLLKISVPAAVIGVALMIIVTNVTPTVHAEECDVVMVDNIGYCQQNEDGSLTPVTEKLFEVDNRENAVLVTKNYVHQFLCFEYITTEKYLEIPKK